MKEYQGHRSWNAWNVSLYLANEYHLYRMVMDFYQEARTRLGYSHERAIRITTAVADLCEEYAND